MRAFFVECSGSHWLGIGRLLAERHGISSVLWSGDAPTVQAAREIFPHVVGVIGVDAARGRPGFEEMNWPQRPLNGPLLRALALDEVVGLSMMDRMDPAAGAFDHDTRRHHWHDLLRQWSAALDVLKPDVVIFAMAPHAIYDFALYALCKHRRVKTRMFERASLPGLVFVLARFEDGSPDLRAAVTRLDGPTFSLSERAQRHLEGLRAGGEAGIPANYRKKLKQRNLLKSGGRQHASGLLSTLLFESKRTAYLLLRRRAAPANYLVRKTPDGHLASPDAFAWLFWRWRGQVQKARLSRLLTRIAAPLVPGAPYVLLTLHYQPERAIVPMAGVFADQTLIVDMLARTLPRGWLLVIKEHPWQLVPFGRGEQGRSAGFYRRIANYPNVLIAPPDLQTHALLRGARAVATATGSAGWQAIACGIPALVFGAAWYRDAPGAYCIDDVDFCANALKAIDGGARVPADAAERMLAALEVVAVPGYLEPQLEEVSNLAERAAVLSMADALVRSIESLTRTSRAKSSTGAR